MIPIILIIIIAGLFILFALYREPAIKIIKELAWDFLFATILLIIIELFYPLPSKWIVWFLAIGMGIILILRFLTGGKAKTPKLQIT